MTFSFKYVFLKSDSKLGKITERFRILKKKKEEMNKVKQFINPKKTNSLFLYFRFSEYSESIWQVLSKS